MPLNLKCPNCGQDAVVPTAAITRRERCTACNTTYAVKDALQDAEAKALLPIIFARKSRMPSRDSFLLGFGLGLPAIACLIVATYWLGYRDTWETDHFTQIIESCEAVHVSVYQGDDDAAETAHLALNTLVEDRTIADKGLVARIALARNIYEPIGKRLAQVRQEQEARDNAAQQVLEARVAAKQLREELRIERELRSQNEARSRQLAIDEARKVIILDGQIGVQKGYWSKTDFENFTHTNYPEAED